MTSSLIRDPAREALARSVALTLELLRDICWARLEAEAETNQRCADPELAARIAGLRGRVRSAVEAWDAAHDENDGYLLCAQHAAASDPQASLELLARIARCADDMYERFRPHLTAFHALLIPAREAGRTARAERRAERSRKEDGR